MPIISLQLQNQILIDLKFYRLFFIKYSDPRR